MYIRILLKQLYQALAFSLIVLMNMSQINAQVITREKKSIGGNSTIRETAEPKEFEFKKQRILLPDNDVKTVVQLMLEYIEQIGGIIE